MFAQQNGDIYTYKYALDRYDVCSIQLQMYAHWCEKQ